MKSFLRTLFAVLVADVIIFGFLLLLMAAIVASELHEVPEVRPGTVLVETIQGPIAEYAAPEWDFSPAEVGVSEWSILENLEKAQHDKRIRAVVLKLSLPQMGFAKMDEIQQRIHELRRTGKPVWAYTEFLDNRSLYLASACDSIFLMRNGYISIHGFSGEHFFLKGTLDKIGVKQQLHKIGAYKSAAEIVQRDLLSDPARRNVEWMYDVYYPNFIRTIEEGRSLEPGTMETKALAAGAMVPAEALDLGLVDRLVYWDEVESSLLKVDGVKATAKERPGLPPRPRTIAGEKYAKVPRSEAGIRSKKTIAIVHAQGYIGGEKSGYVFPLGTTMGSGTMEAAFRQAASNKNVSAIIFRVDSGGGESSTSWRIGHAASLAGKAKPVIVSMCDIAASGAYMVSYPCSTLVADRLSVVGSIGSISGKFTLHDFYDKIGISKDFVTRGPNALIETDYVDYSPDQWEAFTRSHWADYYTWVDDIARMRNLTRAEVDSSGRGRVFTGEQALERKLIDAVGTIDRAIEIAKEKGKIPPDQEVGFVHYPKPPGLLESLRSGGFAAAVAVSVRRIFAPLEKGWSWAVDWHDYSGL